MGDPVAQVHQGGQQPVQEHQPVPSTGPDRPLPRPVGQPCVLARLPARSQLGDQLSEDGVTRRPLPRAPSRARRRDAREPSSEPPASPRVTRLTFPLAQSSLTWRYQDHEPTHLMPPGLRVALNVWLRGRHGGV